MSKIKHDTPAMHTVVRIRIDGIDDELHALVVHRNNHGTIMSFHSPLDKTVVSCSLCENGARVYVL